jgi:hypothetical protein
MGYEATLQTVRMLSRGSAGHVDPDVAFIRARHERETAHRPGQKATTPDRLCTGDDLAELRRSEMSKLVCGGLKPSHRWEWNPTHEHWRCLDCGRN